VYSGRSAVTISLQVPPLAGVEYLEPGSRSHGCRRERDAASCGIEQGSRLS